MKQLAPYLTFKNNCRDAMNFYKDCLGGELELSIVADSPMATQMPPEAKNNVMHSALKINGNIILMASDMMMQGDLVQGNNVNLCITCESKEEIERLFAKLSAGGNVRQPLQDTFFGTYGDFTDKFGIKWMMQLDPVKKS